MAFIHISDGFNLNDRIRLTEPLTMFNGTYTVGHEFTVVGFGVRGIDIEDDEGRRVIECMFVQHTFEKIPPKE